MTEVWKSQAKHFCEICKCWMGGNKNTIQMHENAARHKAAVEQKIRDVGFKSREKEKNDRETQMALRQMEAGAIASYKKDVKRAPHIGMTYDVSRNVPNLHYDTLRSYSLPRSGEPTQETKPEMTYAEAKALHEYLHGPDKDDTVGPSATLVMHEHIEHRDWAEARTPEGNVYYWHTTTGETKWEAPEEGYLTETQQASIIASDSVVNVGQHSNPNYVPPVKKPKKQVKQPPNRPPTKMKQEDAQYFDTESGYMVDQRDSQNFALSAPSSAYSVGSYDPPKYVPEPSNLPPPEQDLAMPTIEKREPLSTDEVADKIHEFKQDKSFRKQKMDPYGSTWSAVEPEPEEEFEDLGLPKRKGEDWKPIVAKQDIDHKMKFKEKTITIKVSKNALPVGFNKRKNTQKKLRRRGHED